MIVASFFLLLYSYFQPQHRISIALFKRYFSLLCIIALFTTFFPSNLKAYALAHMPSSKMAFFGTLDPFVAALGSYVLYNERLSIQKWLGLGIGFLGMLVLIFTSSPLEQSLRAFSVISYPEIAAFFAIVISRFGWILAQDLLKKNIVGPVQINILTMFMGGLLSLVVAFQRAQTTVIPLTHAPLTILTTPPLSLISPFNQLIGFLLYTIIMGNMLGYTLYAKVLKHYSATFIALSGFSIPLMVHLLGWLFLGEQLSFVFFCACGITFSGLLLFFFDERSSNIKSLQ